MSEILEHLLAAENARNEIHKAFKRIGEIATEQLAENEGPTRSIREMMDHLANSSGQHLPAGLYEETQTPAESMTSNGNGSPDKVRPHHPTWEEYEDQGIRIPEIRPATPVELRGLMDKYPMPKAPKTTQEWLIKKERNLAASRLMAERLPERKFMVLDFAELMQAAGLHDSSVDAVKKTLLRHLKDSPDFQETGEPGEMRLGETQQSDPADEPADTGSEDMPDSHTPAPALNGIAAGQPV